MHGCNKSGGLEEHPKIAKQQNNQKAIDLPQRFLQIRQRDHLCH